MKNKLEYYIYPLLLLISIAMFKNNYLYSFFWILMMIFLIIRFGFPKDRNYLKGNTIRIVIISIFSYAIITYGLGLITGFSSNIFNLDILSIIKNIMFPLIIIICQEMIRYMYARKCQYDIKPYIFLTLIYIFLDIVIEFNSTIFNGTEAIFIFICMTVVPKITYHMLYSYITYKVSYVPTLIVRIVFGLYIYVMPIFPNLGNYIMSVLGVIYPYIVYKMVSKNIKYYDKSDRYVVSLRRKYIYFPIILLLIIMVMLVSGIGNYQLIAIGSGSMEPVIYRGDAALFKKVDNYDDIKIGTVLAYKKEGVLITHRVVGINKKNGSYVFKTKGDNNLEVDNYDILQDEVVGIVIYNVKYIGYPTIWLNEKFSKL